MKTKLVVLLTCLSIVTSIAQNSINYKALIKDDLGNVVVNQTVDVQFSILEGATIVYQETHTPTTDNNGIIVLNIGEGTTTDVFEDISWGDDEHWLNVQVDTGSGLIDMGTTQFMAVPYALSSGDNYWSKTGNEIYTTNTSVGINRVNPEHTLDVRSNTQTEPAGFNLSNSDKSRNLRLFSGSDTFPDPSMTWVPGNSLLFATYDDNTSAFEELMHISPSGNVGIGVDDPQARLDILGGDWNLDAGNPGDLRIGNETSNFRIGVATGGGGAGITRMYSQGNSLHLGTNNRPSLTIGQNENVGIGTTTPNTKLQISGGSDASNSNGSGYLVLGNESGANLVFDNNEIIARNNTDSSVLYMQQTGGSTSFGGDVSVSGVATTPSMYITNIEAASSKVLVTREYTEAKYSKRTKEIVIPSVAFQPSSNYHPVPRPLAGGPDLPATNRYQILDNGLLYTVYDTADYMAPLTLPVGTTVNQISAFLYDNEPTNLQFSLTATRLTNNIKTPIFTLYTDNSNSNQTLTHSTPLTILSDYMYFFTITTVSGTDWEDQAIKGIKVIYTE
ncbi:hypothetical protein ACFS5M_08990 [Lacinutrix iliipiscaria]|uniref:Uncharacterized protein n=1 Tax=Lacinutrix iliipiscaria TaxID=1230532 RepID=A0ABW5WNE4_9FLAO